MFNKKLLAGSVLAAMSGAAVATPSFDFTPETYSSQGAASLVDITVVDIEVTSGAEYSDDDLIVVDFNVALAGSYTPPSTLAYYATCDDTGAGDPDATDNGGVLTLGLLSDDAAAGSMTYRVTDVDYTEAGDCTVGSDSSVGALLSLTDIDVDAQEAIAAGSITASYSATLPNGTTVIDGGSIAIEDGTDVVLATFANQYADATGNTLLSGVIDVTTDAPRSDFATDTTTASGSITLSDQTTDLSADAVTNGITLVLEGDFSFLADDSTVAGLTNGAFTVDADFGTAGAQTGIEATTVTATSLTWVLGDTTTAMDETPATIDINFDNSVNIAAGSTSTDGAAMEAGEFTYDLTVSYDDAGTDGADNGSAAGTVALTSGGNMGEFTLNGSETTISNYPLSSAVTQFVWVTNTGTQDGGIYATAIGGTGAQTMASCYVADSASGEVIRITDELNACLADADMTAGRAEITVTVNAASSSIGVYAGYKHNADADRLNLTQ